MGLASVPQLEVFASTVESDVLNGFSFLIPLMDPFACRLDHSVLGFVEIRKLHVCSFIYHNPPVRFCYIGPIFCFLDGRYVQKDVTRASAVALTCSLDFRDILLFRFGYRTVLAWFHCALDNLNIEFFCSLACRRFVCVP